MDIALLSMTLSQEKVQQQASISIMKQAMNSAEANMDTLLKMLGETQMPADAQALQHAAQPHLGGNVDLLV